MKKPPLPLRVAAPAEPNMAFILFIAAAIIGAIIYFKPFSKKEQTED